MHPITSFSIVCYGLMLVSLELSACAKSSSVPPTTPTHASIPKPTQQGHITIQADELILDEHINFATNSDVILEQSYDVLDDIVRLLKEHTEIVALHIHGYTDTRGNSRRNLKLSEQRATSVANYLREKGVNQSIETTGHGEETPLCTENTEECHTQNRRVAFNITVHSP
jgi:outer membrane protein OmpA-like peptidoglycan-associated protein